MAASSLSISCLERKVSKLLEFRIGVLNVFERLGDDGVMSAEHARNLPT